MLTHFIIRTILNLYIGVLEELSYQFHRCLILCKYYPSFVSSLFMQQNPDGMFYWRRVYG